MNNEQLLLRAIIANPDEVTPRLVYADWLDENATTADQHARADFIRVQCYLTTSGTDHPQWETWHARDAELQRAHGAGWMAFIQGRGVSGAAFRRGFVERVRATAHAFATRGAAWCAQTPLREACLTAAAGRTERVAAAPHLGTLTALTFDDRQFGNGDVAALVRGPHFPRLTRLSIRCGGSALGSQGLVTLVGSDRLTELRTLSLESTVIDDRGAAAVAAANLPVLQALSLSASFLGNDGLVALTTSPRLPALSRVCVEYGRVTGAALLALARSGTRSTLRHLGLLGNTLGAVDPSAVADILAANPVLGLDLGMCNLSPAMQEHLFQRFRGRMTVDSGIMQRCGHTAG